MRFVLAAYRATRWCCHPDHRSGRREVYAGAVPPPAEAPIDIALVRALLEEQHPDLAGLPLVDAGEGWDNRTFRLGEGLVVRLPRRAASARLIEHELRWLPTLAPHLPLPVPSPIRIGRAGCGFPWSWSVTRWLPGETALVAPLLDAHDAASDLAGFLRALHRPAPHDAPRNPWRGVPLDARDALLREHLAALAGEVNHAAVIKTWDRCVQRRPGRGPRCGYTATCIRATCSSVPVASRECWTSGMSRQAIRRRTCPSGGCC